MGPTCPFQRRTSNAQLSLADSELRSAWLGQATLKWRLERDERRSFCLWIALIYSTLTRPSRQAGRATSPLKGEVGAMDCLEDSSQPFAHGLKPCFKWFLFDGVGQPETAFVVKEATRVYQDPCFVK